ncbi:MAG: CHAT domain-containing protein [Cyclobacteriaceae bacterium]|nr:CHAT domain-containing protein [Cyclobacteriaceae bacterium]
MKVRFKLTDVQSAAWGVPVRWYAYEIYSCELGSNLTVLTACETGKPSYQAGEGMISLAHAFNYAGSESLLTSLWKIDEQSSAKIVEIFYRNLIKGMEKDEALRAAKLAYLKQSQGRTVHPQYWAGLIIMGDVSPLELDKERPWWHLVLGLLLVTGIIIVVRQFLLKALSEK